MHFPYTFWAIQIFENAIWNFVNTRGVPKINGHFFFGDLEGVACYVDDLCVWSNSLEQHFERLEEVFKRARECGLKFNAGKCEFIKEEIDYSGHVFTKNGTKVDQKKISAIINMPIPKSKQELMRFLGMVTYLMKFIPDMPSKTAPLRELLEKNTEWQ